MSISQGQYIKVKEGDCIYSLAKKYGFKANTISDHTNNKELMKKRSDPCLLLPGDKIFIPAKTSRQEDCATESCHTFRCSNTITKLKVQFLDFDKPLANLPFILKAPGFSYSSETDSDGFIDVSLSLEITNASIKIGNLPEIFEYDLVIGGLDPQDTITGQQQRLANRGLYNGRIDDDFGEVTREAVREFQVNKNLDVSDQLDTQTLDELVKDVGA